MLLFQQGNADCFVTALTGDVEVLGEVHIPEF
jgi:hypothetical protein